LTRGININMENENKKTSEDFIRENIDKANYMLDMAIEAFSEGQLKPSMVEAVARLIDSVTTAANALITAETDSFGLQIKADMLKLKERELDLKTSIGGKPTNQQNIFVGTFNDLLKQINQKEPKQVEIVEIE